MSVCREVLSTMDVTIRPVRPEDLSDLYSLALQPKVISGTLYSPSTRLSDVQKRLENLGPNDHKMVAEVNGKVVGEAQLRVMPGKLRYVGVVDVLVHDEYQGQGIGRALMTTLLDLADNYLGLLRVELEVWEDNAPAIHLYETLGFQIEGRKRKARFRNGEYLDILVMGRVQ